MASLFPDLDQVLARHYSYLHPGLIRYRGAFLDDFALEAVTEYERSAYALLVEKDDAAPYRADFPFLTRGENQSLDRHVDLALVQAWPRPTITIGTAGCGPARVIGTSGRVADPVTVVLRKVGFAQLWWSALGAADSQGEPPVGLIWEAVLDAGPDALLTFLWDCCEAFLERAGVRLCYTTHRDPAYTDAAYRHLLDRREYQVIGRAAPASDRRDLCALKVL